MPPRSKKVKDGGVSLSEKTQMDLTLPPVVFFLKIRKDFVVHEEVMCGNDEVVPSSSSQTHVQTYSDVLRETHDSTSARFDESVVHELISKLHQMTEYPRDTACFWCCHSFSNTAFVIPTHYESYTHTYRGEGHFCSPECALSSIYKDSGLTESERWLRHSLLVSVYGTLYSPQPAEIHPAPDRRVLRMFGGNLDIQQYRELLRNSTRPLQIAMTPIRLYMPSVNTQASARDVKSYVSLTAETVQKATQQLRLKRSKPVHEGTSTLDKCLGVK